MTRLVNSYALNLVQYREPGGFRFVPWQGAGIYRLRVGDDWYIGKSFNIRARFRSPPHPDWEEARVLQLFEGRPSREQLRQAEAYWIDLLRPALNKLTPKVHKHVAKNPWLTTRQFA